MTFRELFEELNTLDGHSHLEAKGCDSSTAGSGIYETICFFNNEPGKKIRSVIKELCAWRTLSAQQITEILGRKDFKKLRREHIKPMIEAGDLKPLYDMGRHPKQAYLATDNKTSDSDED